MIYRILKQSVKADTKKRSFLSGLSSIMNIDPTLSFVSYKDQSQDIKMLANDMQRIGGDFQIAINKVVVNEPRNS